MAWCKKEGVQTAGAGMPALDLHAGSERALEVHKRPLREEGYPSSIEILDLTKTSIQQSHIMPSCLICTGIPATFPRPFR